MNAIYTYRMVMEWAGLPVCHAGGHIFCDERISSKRGNLCTRCCPGTVDGRASGSLFNDKGVEQ